MNFLEVDAQAISHPFAHVWERMFGSGRAVLSLSENYLSGERRTRSPVIDDFLPNQLHPLVPPQFSHL